MLMIGISIVIASIVAVQLYRAASTVAEPCTPLVLILR